MHGMRWPCSNEDIHGMRFKVFFQKFYRWFYPKFSGIRYEKVASYPYRNFWFPILFALRFKLSPFKFLILFIEVQLTLQQYVVLYTTSVLYWYQVLNILVQHMWLSATISVVTICHHTMLLQYYWWHSLCYTFHLSDLFIP